MRFYNVDMKGKFWNQRGTADPSTDPSNEGRLFYNETTELLKLHNSTGWDEIVTASNAPSVIGGDFLRKDQDDTSAFELQASKVKSGGGYFRGQLATSLRTLDENTYAALSQDTSFTVVIAGGTEFQVTTAAGYLNGGTIWTSLNDGVGSGLDADLLDGQSSAYYLSASNLNAGTVPQARLSGTYNISITGTARYA